LFKQAALSETEKQLKEIKELEAFLLSMAEQESSSCKIMGPPT
jgi:hypothetical protein